MVGEEKILVFLFPLAPVPGPGVWLLPLSRALAARCPTWGGLPGPCPSAGTGLPPAPPAVSVLGAGCKRLCGARGRCRWVSEGVGGGSR